MICQASNAYTVEGAKCCLRYTLVISVMLRATVGISDCTQYEALFPPNVHNIAKHYQLIFNLHLLCITVGKPLLKQE